MTRSSKTLGILGGGQLGRMAALAAARLGIAVHIYCPEGADCPAGQVATRSFAGSYDDQKALKAFAESVDAITYEFENIPVETVRFLQKFKPVHPDDKLLEVAQDRVREKQFLNDIGIPTAAWMALEGPADIDRAAEKLGRSELILKTTRFGYDGKGQTKWRKGDDSKAKWASLKSDSIIAEEIVDFVSEISVIIARDKIGQTVVYGPMMNEHKNHMLDKSIVPAPVPPALADKALDMARHLADAVDLVGVLALELFVTRDGRVLANEIAPRPHNSGHWTIDACAVSQFEQQARAACGLPVAPPGRHSDCVMINLVGDDINDLSAYLEQDGACIHDYGKPEARPGRKMGHVTLLKPMVS